MDPRVKTSLKDLQQQHDLGLLCYENIFKATKALKQNPAKNEMAAKELNQYIGRFRSLQSALQESDNKPTSQLITAVTAANKGFDQLIKR